MNKDFIISLLSGLFGVILTIVASWLLAHEQLEFSKKIEMLKLAKELTHQFYDENSTYKDIQTAIDKCENLYDQWGGKFGFYKVNQYLVFFDSIGFYESAEVLDYKIIDQLLGANIIEAYEKKELKRYIDDIRRNNEQHQAFDEFERLAKKLEDIPERKNFVENLKRKTCFNEFKELKNAK